MAGVVADQCIHLWFYVRLAAGTLVLVRFLTGWKHTIEAVDLLRHQYIIVQYNRESGEWGNPSSFVLFSPPTHHVAYPSCWRCSLGVRVIAMALFSEGGRTRQYESPPDVSKGASHLQQAPTAANAVPRGRNRCRCCRIFFSVVAAARVRSVGSTY